MVDIILPKETVLFTMECQSCGSSVKVKMNKDGILYYYCSNKRGGKICKERHWFGKWGSERLKEEWLEEQRIKHEGEIKNVQLEEREETRRDCERPQQRDIERNEQCGGGEEGGIFDSIAGAIFG